MSSSPSVLPALVVERDYSASPETLFTCWTNQEHLKRWFAPTPSHETTFAEADPRVGGKYRIGILDRDTGKMHIVTGFYREIVPFERLVFSWAWLEPTPTPETLVTVEFRPTAEGTKLVLTHEQFPTAAMRDSHEKGWGGCLNTLAGVV